MVNDSRPHNFLAPDLRHGFKLSSFIFIARNSSCGKVMFSQMSVRLREVFIPACNGTELSAQGMSAQGGVCPPRRPLKRPVRILLECILVSRAVVKSLAL